MDYTIFFNHLTKNKCIKCHNNSYKDYIYCKRCLDINMKIYREYYKINGDFCIKRVINFQILEDKN